MTALKTKFEDAARGYDIPDICRTHDRAGAESANPLRRR
jgi:hypothetical protein